MLPTFRTARLTLRPRSLAETEACLAMDSDPAVVRFIPGPWDDPARHRAFVEARTRGPYPPGLGYWSILTDQFLGWILLAPLDGGVEIGWRLVQAAWGQGYATEAARPVLRHGFTTAGLPEIFAIIDPANTASRNVAAKIGLEEGGLTEKGHVRYALTRDAYLKAVP